MKASHVSSSNNTDGLFLAESNMEPPFWSIRKAHRGARGVVVGFCSNFPNDESAKINASSNS